ncbi:MAG: T9SS type A sorting domain-containing protein [Ignavibacteria bacterium]|nr:T9SS type A sorting domain-containing protein [Ignavibacteria bacterium]
MRRKPEIHADFINAKVFCFAVVLFAIICSTSFGQSITWQRILDNNYGSLYQAQQTKDGGYIAVGSDRIDNTNKLYLTKVDFESNTEWTKIFGIINTEGTWVIETDDHGFAVCGRTDSAGWDKCYLVKTDLMGNVLWQKMYNVSDMDKANCLKQTNDGGYIIAGYTFPLRTGIYLIKTDSYGNSVHQKVYYNPNESKVAKEFVIMNGFYYVIGDIFYDNQTDVFIMKLSNELDSIWTKRFGGTNNDFGYSIDSIKHNELIFTGSSNSYNSNNKYESLVCKMDTNGNIIWQHTYSGLGREISRSIRVINDSLYVFSGSSDSLNNNTNKAKIRLIDYNGNVLFENSYLPGTVGAGFESTELTSDNGFISSGYVIQNGAVENMYIVKSDSLLKAQPIGLINISENIPQKFRVYPNYPNPFNPVTSINFDISTKTEVKLIIYNTLGQTIESINFGSQNAGSYNYKWQPTNIPSGIYFCKVIAGDSFNIIKMALLK